MDPYKILNISKDASEAEIKKAYRKLAAKHHPDKGGDEETFKKINEAHSAISTPEKRQEHENSQQFGGLGDIFGDLFEGFFGSGSGASHNRGPQEETDDQIMFDIRVSLAQVKEGVSQNIVFERNKTCFSCSGIGGENKQVCGSCTGTGVQRMRLGPIIQQMTCRDCYGKGSTFETVCSSCSGIGLIKIKEIINFELKQKT